MTSNVKELGPEENELLGKFNTTFCALFISILEPKDKVAIKSELVPEADGNYTYSCEMRAFTQQPLSEDWEAMFEDTIDQVSSDFAFDTFWTEGGRPVYISASLPFNKETLDNLQKAHLNLVISQKDSLSTALKHLSDGIKEVTRTIQTLPPSLQGNATLEIFGKTLVSDAEKLVTNIAAARRQGQNMVGRRAAPKQKSTLGD
jgi:hypothetical protein